MLGRSPELTDCKAKTQQLNKLLTAALKTRTIRWLKPEPPTCNIWIQKVCGAYLMEHITYSDYRDLFLRNGGPMLPLLIQWRAPPSVGSSLSGRTHTFIYGWHRERGDRRTASYEAKECLCIYVCMLAFFNMLWLDTGPVRASVCLYMWAQLYGGSVGSITAH